MNTSRSWEVLSLGILAERFLYPAPSVLAVLVRHNQMNQITVSYHEIGLLFLEILEKSCEELQE
jgi:hypothetical protein